MFDTNKIVNEEPTFCGMTEHELYLNRLKNCKVSYAFSSFDINDDDYNDWKRMRRNREK